MGVENGDKNYPLWKRFEPTTTSSLAYTTGVQCPYCGHPDQRVLDSRPTPDGGTIRRRRECPACTRRFTTIERAERPRLFAVKRGGGREEFSRDKLLASMRVACRKRPVSVERLEAAAAKIERDLLAEPRDEATTREIGRRVMAELSVVDTVAYVRFASVYEDFDTVSDFARIVETVQRDEALARLEPLATLSN